MPENVTPERKRILRAYGAELVLTDPLEGSPTARSARSAASTPRIRSATSTRTSTATRPTGSAHYDTTGPEILAQTDGRITHFVAGLGTSGTFVGTGRYLRDQKPARAAGLGAARHGAARPRRPEAHGVGDRAGIYDPALADVGPAGRHRGRVRCSRGASRTKRACSSASRAARRSRPACRSPARLDRRRHRDDLLRRRREVPVGALLGGAARGLVRRRRELMARRAALDAGVRGRHPRARARDLPARVLRRAARRATACVASTCALPNTTEEGPRRRFLVRPATTSRPSGAARAAGRGPARVLPLASRSPGAAVAVRSRPRAGRSSPTSSSR